MPDINASIRQQVLPRGGTGMIRALLFGLALAGAATPATAGMPDDKPIETLKRNGAWQANYDRDSCKLSVQLGEGKASVIAQFTRYQPGDSFDLAVYGVRFFTTDVKVDGTADYGLSPKPIVIDGMSGNAGKYQAIFFSGMRLDGWEGDDRNKNEPQIAPKITPEQEARVSGVTLRIRGRRPLRLEFGSFAKPLAEMRKCMDELVKSWGYDPLQQAAGLRAVSPITAPGTWLNYNDYPMGALRNGANGIVQFRLDVDPEGKVAGCYILARTNPDQFADITCKAITRRARLQPALDAQGKPMRSFWIQKVKWLAS